MKWSHATTSAEHGRYSGQKGGANPRVTIATKQT